MNASCKLKLQRPSMFERYTEKARRVIFFARYEASQFASPYIETEHMLLGLVREDKALAFRFLRGTDFESLRNQIEARTSTKEKPTPTSVDLPLSNECKRVLAYAAEEAERLAHKHIGTEHLLLGLLREEQSFAAELLRAHSVHLEAIRKELKAFAHGMPGQPLSARSTPAVSVGANLVAQVVEGQLPALVGRGQQVETLIHALGRSTKKNAVLVGEAGVGRRSIAIGLAQRIAEGKVPRNLAEKRISELNISQILGGHRVEVEGFLKQAVRELKSMEKTLFLIDELHSLLATAPSVAATDATDLLKSALEMGKIQCICTALPEDFRKATAKHHWLSRCFRPIEVPPMTEAEAMEVVLSAKARLEKFHSVAFDDDALEAAVRESNVHVKDRYLPDKALDLLDEAAAYVNASRANWPPELIEVQQQLKFVAHRTEDAIANHEFEKARYYSEEEHKVRQTLSELQKKHDAGGVHHVTRRDVEEVLARWLGVSVDSLRQTGGPDKPPKAQRS
jgi:ATP-dependent Clp protease ATP-binding subunit ClpC